MYINARTLGFRGWGYFFLQKAKVWSGFHLKSGNIMFAEKTRDESDVFA